MQKGAVISECGKYRYSLVRDWRESEADEMKRVCFMMLNPSTADAEVDDPTIRKCIGFARRWGYTSIEVVNLFAYRATNPQELLKIYDPTDLGYDEVNRHHISVALWRADRLVVGWGSFIDNKPMRRVLLPTVDVIAEVFGVPCCLGQCLTGSPRHPLYISYDAPLEVFDVRSCLNNWR